MKTLFMLLIFASGIGPAQTKLQDPDQKYYDYRYEITKPPFGLEKIERVLARNQTLSNRAFQSLKLDEKFTYVMLHGEQFSQGCAALPFIPQPGHKIFARPAEGLAVGDEFRWSKEQIEFLHKNRARVLDLLLQTIQKRQRVGANLKMAIEELDAHELIPDMLEVFDVDHKDLDILALCLVLMKDGHYKPFLNSQAYNTLFGPKSNERSALEANRSNIAAIEAMAMAYFWSARP